jgi:hypothetical protein
MEEKMTENKQEKIEKNPVGAAILSALFPGVGFFYIGNYLKGIAYILVFASLIVMVSQGRGHEAPIFGIMLAGFYIFQIFDSFNDAKKTRYRKQDEETGGDEKISLGASIIIVVVGAVFQMAELHIISYRHIAKLWPLILIAFGIRFIYIYMLSERETKNGDDDQWEKLEKPTGGENE